MKNQESKENNTKSNEFSFMSKTFALTDAHDENTKHEIKLSISDPMMILIHEWYERACTAEYILTNELYAKRCHNKEDIAYRVADAVRIRMDKYDETESEAIDYIFDNYDIEEFA